MAAPAIEATLSRTKYAVAPIIMQVLLGMLYSWSIFRPPLAQAYGWNNVQTNAPFSYSILGLVAGTLLGGFWQDRVGPRLVATVGGVVIGIGWALSALVGANVNALIITYGCLVGIGTGFGYVAPIATLVKWFPDKRGMMVGLAVMGIGVSPLVFAPAIQLLLGNDKAQFASTIPVTFLALAVVEAVGVALAAQFCQAPPAGWRPAGWEPSQAKAVSRQQRSPVEMLKSWQFYLLWIVYFLGASVGLTAISQVSPLVKTLAATSAAFSGAFALGMMSVFNGVGRLAWGSVSDRLGRIRTVLVMCAFAACGSGLLLRGATGFWQLLAGLCVVAFAYGGYLALMPSMTADYYGPKHVGANYGLVFTAFGIAGFIVPDLLARIVDSAKKAGNITEGYNQVYLILALASVACAALCLALRPPRESA